VFGPPDPLAFMLTRRVRHDAELTLASLVGLQSNLMCREVRGTSLVLHRTSLAYLHISQEGILEWPSTHEP